MDTLEQRIEARMSKDIVNLQFFTKVNRNNPVRNEFSATKRELRFFLMQYDYVMSVADPNYSAIAKYINDAEQKYPDIQYYEELFDNYDINADRDLSINEFVRRIFMKYNGPQNAVFNNTFVDDITLDFKARERILKEKIPALKSENLLIVHDATFFANYSKGFVITEKVLVDLKTGQVLRLDDIVDVIVGNDFIDAKTANNTFVRFNVNSPVVKLYAETILKAYSQYKGRYKREEAEKLEKDIAREDKLVEYSSVSAAETYGKGLEALEAEDFYEAELRFSAIERIENNEKYKALGYLGKAITSLDDDKQVIDLLNKAVACEPSDKDMDFTMETEVCINYVNPEGYGLLSSIVGSAAVNLLKHYCENYNVDLTRLYNKATLLDISIYNRKINREKTADYREIEEYLENKGCERKWNIEFDAVYVPFNTINEVIKKSIFKSVVQSNNEIKIGEDLRRSMPDRCQKAVMNLGVKQDEEVYLIYDNTTFKSLKNGFSITSGGIYVASEMGEHLLIPWKDIMKAQIAFNNGCIYFEGGKLSANPANANLIMKMFDDVKYELKEFDNQYDYAAEESAEEEAEKTAEEPVEEVVDETTDEPAGEVVEKTAAEPEEEVVDEIVEEPEEEVIDETIAEETAISENIEEQAVLDNNEEPEVSESIDVPVSEAIPEVPVAETIPEIPVAETIQEVPVEPVVSVDSAESETATEPETVEESELTAEPEITAETESAVTVQEVQPAAITAPVEEVPAAIEEPEPEFNFEDISEKIIKQAQDPTEKQCKNCGAFVSINSKFCTKCGNKFEKEEVKKEEPVKTSNEIKCDKCGKVLKATAKFCTGCGNPVQIKMPEPAVAPENTTKVSETQSVAEAPTASAAENTPELSINKPPVEEKKMCVKCGKMMRMDARYCTGCGAKMY